MTVVIDLLHPDTNLKDTKALVKKQTIDNVGEEAYNLMHEIYDIIYDETLTQSERGEYLYETYQNIEAASTHTDHDDEAPASPEEALEDFSMDSIFGTYLHEPGKIIHGYVMGNPEYTHEQAQQARYRLKDEDPDASMNTSLEV